MPTGALTIRRLVNAEQVSGFCCRNGSGAEDLEDFIKHDALRYQEKNLSRIYLAHGDLGLVGYFALCCCAIKLQPARPVDIEAARAAQLGDDAGIGIPGVLLARLAVDDRYQGRGVGKELFSWAYRISRTRVAPLLGCRFLIVDAYSDRAPFYEKRGCQRIGKQKDGSPVIQMYLDLFPPTTPSPPPAE